jgi:hypothetical protein
MISVFENCLGKRVLLTMNLNVTKERPSLPGPLRQERGKSLVLCLSMSVRRRGYALSSSGGDGGREEAVPHKVFRVKNSRARDGRARGSDIAKQNAHS